MPVPCLLYYITDRKTFAPDELTRRRRLLEKIAEATRANVDYIQLREKDLSARELETLAREAASIIQKLRTENADLKTAILINSRTDIAIATGADGVHLRSDDISPQEVRAIWKQALTRDAPHLADVASPRNSEIKFAPLVAVSCHTSDEILEAAAEQATFAVFAPIFEKKGDVGSRPAGLAKLREACRASIPVLALGGIALANARDCLDAGASGIAAIRLFQDNDVADVVARLRSL